MRAGRRARTRARRRRSAPHGARPPARAGARAWWWHSRIPSYHDRLASATAAARGGRFTAPATARGQATWCSRQGADVSLRADLAVEPALGLALFHGGGGGGRPGGGGGVGGGWVG